MAVGHYLCSNVSLGLSQACLCSSSLTLVSVTVLRLVSCLTNVGKFLPRAENLPHPMLHPFLLISTHSKLSLSLAVH